MKICFMCDLHLPTERGALQYDVLRWAREDIQKACAEAVIYAGDVTCDGNETVYDLFLDTLKEMGIPFFYIPGNSDLRDRASRESIARKASPCRNSLGKLTVYAVNDADKSVSEEQLAALDAADGASIVFLHHPLEEHKNAERLLAWRETHPEPMLFYGHLHQSSREGRSVSLQAMDPDKAIGENPCITYYDTETNAIEQVYYPIEMPDGLERDFGISCYKPLEQIEFAIRHGLRYLELRPNCVRVESDELCAAVARWREAGGEQLSIHLPDVGWVDGALWVHEDHAATMRLVRELRAERVTQHVPKASLKEINQDPEILPRIAEYLSEQFNAIEHSLTVGVENMHMTAKDEAGENRRFGYIPEECIAFMELIARSCRHTVGINFDIGHARNNAPYSQTYQISTWLAMLGHSIVGYHIHQVLRREGKFENHMPITDVYGPLISFASLLHSLATDRVSRAPFVFEMRGADAYEQTLQTFSDWKDHKKE